MKKIRKKIKCLILPVYLMGTVLPVSAVYAEEAVQKETEEVIEIKAGEEKEVRLPLSEAEYTADENEYIQITSSQKTDTEIIVKVKALKASAENVSVILKGDTEVTLVFSIKEEEKKVAAEPEVTEAPEKKEGTLPVQEEVKVDEEKAKETEPAVTETEPVDLKDVFYEIGVTDGNLTGEFVTENSVVKAAPGKELKVTAKNKTGYLFINWSVSGLENVDKKSNPLTFTMPETNVTLSANYMYRWKENDNGWRYIVSIDNNNAKKYAKSEWIAENGKWYYFDIDGYALKNTFKALTNNKGVSHTFYFKSDSTMAVGWVKVGNHYYHFDSNGYMNTGWFQNGKVWYYLAPSNGAMATGWQTIGGKKYYFRSDGQMVSGQYTVDGMTYSFGADGALKTNCWLKLNGDWYYLNADGQYAKGWKEINDKRYFFLQDGKMAVGWVTDGGNRYYSDKNGMIQKTGWTKIDNVWYYLGKTTGKAKTGWMQEGDVWYFFKADGAMATGWAKTGGYWYYFNSSGAMQKGWKAIGGKWYYLNSSGAMKTGWFKDGGVWYFLKADGSMATGWAKDGKTWYYFNNSGIMQKGWQAVGGKWYYLNASGAMQTGWLKEGSKWYYLKAAGDMAIGWTKVGSDYYYMNKSGVMQTGWLTIGRNKYYLKSSGAMTTGIAKVDGIVRYFDKNSGVLKNIETAVSASDVVLTSSSSKKTSNAAAAAILTALNAKGYGFETYNVFLDGMPADATNPMKGYYGGVINSIYPSAAADWVAEYGKTENISGSSAEAVLNYVNDGKLVVVWIPKNFDGKAQVKQASYGNYIEYTQAAVVYGYDSLTGEVKVADPSGKGLTTVSFDVFKTAYEKLKYGITVY